MGPTPNKMGAVGVARTGGAGRGAEWRATRRDKARRLGALLRCTWQAQGQAFTKRAWLKFGRRASLPPPRFVVGLLTGKCFCGGGFTARHPPISQGSPHHRAPCRPRINGGS